MNLDAVLVVDISHDVIARDGMATVWEDKLVDVLLCDDERFLLVEILAHDEELLWLGSAFYLLLFLVLSTEEWDVVTPTAGLFLLLVLALQFVDVFLAQDDGMVAESQEEVVVLLDVVEVAELIYARGAYLHTVLLEPLIEYFLALLLHLSIITAQDGLYLALRLGCAHEVDPAWLYVLALTGEDFHLVATLQLMAQWHQLVVDLGTDAVASQESVYLESKVECRTVGWHRLDFTLWCEDEDFGCEEVELDGIEEVHGVRLRVIEDFLDGT